jgi:hypothetical protein
MTVVDGTRDTDRGATRSNGPALRALIGLLARTSGIAAARRGLPTYLGLFVIAVILFQGNGVRSRDVVALALTSPPTRIVLLAAWLLLALPAARAVVGEPSTFLIRTWPIPRAHLLGVTTALLLLVEAPWALLWFKGGGAIAGTAATVLAIGGHGLLLARPRAVTEVGAALLWALAVAMLSSPLLALGAGVPAVWLGVRRAFVAAPERIGVRRSWRLVRAGRSPVIGLALAQLASVARAQRPALVRAIWFAAGGALMAGLAAANNGIVEPDRMRVLWRTISTLTIGWGAAGLVGGVQRLERQSEWLLVVCGVTPPQRRLAAALALGLLGAGLGAIAGMLLGRFSPAGTPTPTAASLSMAVAMAADGALAGAAGSVAASAVGRWACRGDGGDGGRLLTTMPIAGLLLAPLAWLLPSVALPIVAAVTLVLPEPLRDRRLRAGGPAALGAGER